VTGSASAPAAVRLSDSQPEIYSPAVNYVAEAVKVDILEELGCIGNEASFYHSLKLSFIRYLEAN